MPSASMRSSLAPRSRSTSRGLERAAARPTRRWVGRSRNIARRTNAANVVAAHARRWAPAGVGHSVPAPALAAASARAPARARGRRAPCAPGRRRRARAVLYGAWIASTASSLLGLGQRERREAVEVRVARRPRRSPVDWPGSSTSQQRPGAALEQRALQREQQRRRERRRAHDDLLARLDVEAVAAESARAKASGSTLTALRASGEVLRQVLT